MLPAQRVLRTPGLLPALPAAPFLPSAGEAERTAALDEAEAHSAAAAALLDRVWDLQRQAEEASTGEGRLWGGLARRAAELSG